MILKTIAQLHIDDSILIKVLDIVKPHMASYIKDTVERVLAMLIGVEIDDKGQI